MSLHQALLDQARFLVELDDRRPKQASLRRAISSAYYALFHLLAEEASSKFSSQRNLRNLTRRALIHAEMKTVSWHFIEREKRTKESKLVFPEAIPPGLSYVAKTFVELQEERHRADYKIDHVFRRREVRNLIFRVDKAFSEWKLVRGTPAANAFLASLVMWKKWKFDDL